MNGWLSGGWLVGRQFGISLGRLHLSMLDSKVLCKLGIDQLVKNNQPDLLQRTILWILVVCECVDEDLCTYLQIKTHRHTHQVDQALHSYVQSLVPSHLSCPYSVCADCK